MTIKSQGGIFGRNPTFNNVTVENDFSSSGDFSIAPTDMSVSMEEDASGEIYLTDSRSGTGPMLYLRNLLSTSSTGQGSGIRFAGAGVSREFRIVTSSAGTFGRTPILKFQGQADGEGLNDLVTIHPSSGTVELLVGDLKVASGKGIDFSATSGSGTSELLDDYEEGDWTPIISASTTAPTVSSYSDRIGRYVKVGRMVTAMCQIRANLSSAGSGYPVITGLPFDAEDVSLMGASVGLQNLFTTFPQAGYVSSTSVRFENASYRTGANNYICFSITYEHN